ncbi:MAG: YHYH protein [Phycisphaerales bacterium]|nr:YHYH protein [Phycisphaerales bacterium]
MQDRSSSSVRGWVCGAASLAVCAGPALADPTTEAWYFRFYGRMGQSPDAAMHALVSVIPADVVQVRYTANNTYVNASGVPSYPVGPFPDGNPSYPSDVAWLVRVPHAPVEQPPPKTPTGNGTIGLWVNGVAVYNAKDAHSYMGLGVWNQNAVVVEADGFDAALGHSSPLGPPAPPLRPGLYHHHQNPIALREQLGDDGTHHSPILGYAFDGFPIYGPYGYANPDGTGGVRRMVSGYRARSITVRTTLPDGTVLPPAQYGPAVDADYPIGYYVEDFEYVGGLGDLNRANARFEVTPEYPGGTWAYHTTIDAAGASAYPYSVGPIYFGVLQTDNTTRTVMVPPGAAVFDPCSVPMAISEDPAPARTCGGGSAEFTVKASGVGGSGPFGYEWRRDGVVLSDVPGHIAGSATSELTITDARPGEAGGYSCRVTGGCGEVISAEAELTVCVADMNCDGLVDFPDYLEFLNLYIAHDPRADITLDGLVDFVDYLEFLNFYEAGC